MIALDLLLYFRYVDAIIVTASFEKTSLIF